MSSLTTVFEWFRIATLGELVGLALAQNMLIVLFSVLLGEALVWLFRHKRVSEVPEPVTWPEYALVGSSIVLNSVVAVVGVLLWRAGYIQVTYAAGWHALLDVAVLVLSLDLLMYVFHRVAHHPWLYRWVHATHHIYDKPRPLTLFALNPIEALGFGFMLILVCLVYPVSALGLTIYLVLNVLFGLVGHIGVEPLPQQWLRLPVLRSISTSTFHAEHHHDGQYNFGFYTLLWDKLFGTQAPEYSADFSGAGQRTIQSRPPR